MATVSLSPNGMDRYARGGPPDRLLVGTMDGVADLRKAPSGWVVQARSLPGVHISALLYDTARDETYAGSHGDGMFLRRGDQAWAPISTGLEHRNVFTLARNDRGTLFVGTEPAHLYHSIDRGAVWAELTALRDVPGVDQWNFPAPPHVAHVKHVDFDPRNEKIMYVSIEQGALLKSTDGGRTFRELTFQDESYALNKDVHRVVINPQNPDELFLPGGDGIAHSTDAGETWEHLTTPQMRVGYPDATFVAPDGALYTTGGGTPPNVWRQTGDAASTVARSRDGGKTWEDLALPHLRGNIEAATLVTWSGGYGFLAGTTDGEVFASMDQGQTWEQIASGLAPVSKCIHHRNLQMGRGAA
jgi:photosystem II stability/assembly factor-like uncharacterized protein